MTTEIKPEIINKFRFKRGKQGLLSRRIITLFMSNPTGLTINDITRKLNYDYNCIVEAMRRLRKKGLIKSEPAKLFNSKAHGQQLIHFLED